VTATDTDSISIKFLQTKAMLILFVGLRNRRTSKSEKKIKVPHYHFSPAFFSVSDLSPIKKNFPSIHVVD
jgi:hypothetical protein